MAVDMFPHTNEWDLTFLLSSRAMLRRRLDRFGFSKKDKLRKDLPAICINRKEVKGLFGRTKIVPVSKRDQRKIKKQLMEKYPDRYFVDDLNEWNSVKKDELSWIDDIEDYLAATEEFDVF